MLAYIMFPHYVGIVTGLFNYPLFTNGTIRNQIGVGHYRSHIYLADWAASNLFAVALYLAFACSFFGTFAVCADTADVSAKAIASAILVSVLQVVFFTTVTQLFCVILKGVKSFLAIYLGNQVIMLLGIGYAESADTYNLPEKLSVLFPTVVCMRQSSFAVDPELLTAVVVMLAETLLVFLFGMMYFRQTDLN